MVRRGKEAKKTMAFLVEISLSLLMTGKPALNRIRTETGQELPGLETETRQRIERGNELSVPNPWIWIPGKHPGIWKLHLY